LRAGRSKWLRFVVRPWFVSSVIARGISLIRRYRGRGVSTFERSAVLCLRQRMGFQPGARAALAAQHGITRRLRSGIVGHAEADDALVMGDQWTSKLDRRRNQKPIRWIAVCEAMELIASGGSRSKPAGWVRLSIA
jgi:hypothetical protein